MLTTKNSAKRRNYAFELTYAEFKSISQQNCFYCGSEPYLRNKYCNSEGKIHKGQEKHSYTAAAIERSWIKLNGIDRLDNDKGYIFSNCVPCCTMCNKMKTEMSIKEFFIKIKNILLREKVIHARAYPEDT